MFDRLAGAQVSVALFVVPYMLILTFVPVIEFTAQPLKSIAFGKLLSSKFPLVLFIMLNKVVLLSESVIEILVWPFTNENCRRY